MAYCLCWIFSVCLLGFTLQLYFALCQKLMSMNCVNLTSLPFSFWLGWPMEGIKRKLERKRGSVYFFDSRSVWGHSSCWLTLSWGCHWFPVTILFTSGCCVPQDASLSFVISLNCLSFVSSLFIQQSSIIPFEWAVSCCAIVTKRAEDGRKGGSVSSWVSSRFTQYVLEIR